jgi:hypothetical protein
MREPGSGLTALVKGPERVIAGSPYLGDSGTVNRGVTFEKENT